MELINAIIGCFPCIESRCGEEILRMFCENPYPERYRYHFNLGLFIRNELLSETKPLLTLFLRYGITNKDDMSDLILQLLYVCEKEKRK